MHANCVRKCCRRFNERQWKHTRFLATIKNAKVLYVFALVAAISIDLNSTKENTSFPITQRMSWHFWNDTQTLCSKIVRFCLIWHEVSRVRVIIIATYMIADEVVSSPLLSLIEFPLNCVCVIRDGFICWLHAKSNFGVKLQWRFVLFVAKCLHSSEDLHSPLAKAHYFKWRVQHREKVQFQPEIA